VTSAEMAGSAIDKAAGEVKKFGDINGTYAEFISGGKTLPNAVLNLEDFVHQAELARKAKEQFLEEGYASGIDLTDSFNTSLTPEQEAKFQAWAASAKEVLGRNLNQDLSTYDMRGLWKDEISQGMIEGFKEGMHFIDTYKKPNHPTFSDESKYSSKEYSGGKWGEGTFAPSKDQMKAGWDPKLAQQYFDRIKENIKVVTPQLKDISEAAEFGYTGDMTFSTDELAQVKLMVEELKTLDVERIQAIKDQLLQREATSDVEKRAMALVALAIKGVEKATAEIGTTAELAAKQMGSSTDSMVTNLSGVLAVTKDLVKELEKVGKLQSSSSSSGARALGGPVASGGTYLVGEKGPELFSPKSSGFIIPNDKLSGSRNVVDINLSVNGSEPVTVQGNSQTVDQLKRAFKDSERYAA